MDFGSGSYSGCNAPGDVLSDYSAAVLANDLQGAMGVGKSGLFAVWPSDFGGKGLPGLDALDNPFDPVAELGYGFPASALSPCAVSELGPSGVHSLLREEDLNLFNSLTTSADCHWCLPAEPDCASVDKGAPDSFPTPPAKPPKRIRDYLLGPVLGEGAFGKVREAIHLPTLRRVAVKVMRKRTLRKVKGGLQGLETEIMVMRQLAGCSAAAAHVLGLNEVIRCDQKIAIVMDYAVTSLQHLIDCQYHRRLPEKATSLIFQQVLLGLAHMHSRSVVHKDIKPANLMIMPDGTVKISDFGVAEVLSIYEAAPKCDRSQGTPAFQCPELAAGRGQFDGFKADVWAAGVSLYVTLTGRMPFSGKALYHLYENICKEPFSTEGLSDLVAQLLCGMLEKEEEGRWSVDECLRWPWIAHAAMGPYRQEDLTVVCCPDSCHFAKAFSPHHSSIALGQSDDDLGGFPGRSASEGTNLGDFGLHCTQSPSSPPLHPARPTCRMAERLFLGGGHYLPGSGPGGDVGPGGALYAGSSQSSSVCSSVSTVMGAAPGFGPFAMPMDIHLARSLPQPMGCDVFSADSTDSEPSHGDRDRRMERQMKEGGCIHFGFADLLR
eukprot:EG_transcript_7269